MAALFLIAELATVAVSTVKPGKAQAAVAPTGQGFTVTPGDLKFILNQIKISERHAATLTPNDPCGTLVGSGPDQVPDRLTAFGLRTVDGSCNNLFAGRETFAAADETFPRLTKPVFKDAENATFGPPVATSYKQKKGNVFDSHPRTVSNLIVDQTSTNPAAVQAAGFPVRTQGNPGKFPCTTDPDPLATPPVEGVPADCVPSHQTLFIPNVTTDVGLSPPYNSLFTFFGQFFDHGVDQTVKSGASVFIPLKDDDPLVTLGPDGKPNTNDEVPASQRFMVLTRAQNQPGPDGVLGDDPDVPGDQSADDIQDATNTDSPWVDQSQTYTSHSSHQVFLREYVLNANKPVDTGKLLGGLPGNGASGMATWATVKAQAASMLGLKLVDRDVTNIPMIAADPYGNFIPGPNGLAQYVTATGLVEGDLANPVSVPANVRYFDTPFLTDIAHNADPSPADLDHNPATPKQAPTPDADTAASADFASQPAGTYDDEMLDAHFAAGDGRVNENIALTAVHQIFHSEHDRLVADIKKVLTDDTSAGGVAALAQWKLATGADGWNGQRLFQAARFITEMEYQHLVFEEFARKVQPAVRPFAGYLPDVDPAIPAEFAHAVYRFGHSMLDDDVARTNVDKSDNSIPLLKGFLNPPEYFNGGSAGQLTPQQAAGSIFMGSADQAGNELDEFVTETLRNNLLGLPLDLPTINMTRAREAGVPPLNEVRRQIFAQTNDGQMAPYTDWSDFGQHLKHPTSLINFVAAYGKHPTIISATTLAAKRAAAKAIVDPGAAPATDPADIPDDAQAFMFSTGPTWGTDPDTGASKTGVDDVDLWVGGLAELTNVFGGLLGSTFNYVFQSTLENLQDGDRLYYLRRTPGLNLRAQLEGNSFAEMVQRNTDGTNTLKADVFATADCKFQLGNLAGTAAGFTQFGPTVGDDLGSDCEENNLLLRKPDGTIQYRQFNSVDPSGINGQGVYNGTRDADRVVGGNDNDTFWGGEGKDAIEGNGGDDVSIGGDGNDSITDLSGDDVLKGGPGNDAIDGGLGLDIIMGGDGRDFTNGGANDNETFGGEGGDFIFAGNGLDGVFGDGGSDWLQGGTGVDLLQGDHGAPFLDDPGAVTPGHDIFIGQTGDNDYDAEGGDDIMAQTSSIEKNEGSGGFDWASNQYITAAADDDMAINNRPPGLPLPVVVNRDRWTETEADSGSRFDDVIRGDNDVPAAVGGDGFTGCNVLDQAGVDRIHGLAALVPQPLTGPLAPVVAASAAGSCPLEGPTWGEGNILLGGAGRDTIEGRGADDIIDGDKALTVRISVRTNPADPTSEIGSTDLMERQYLRDANGALTGPTLQAAVFKGTVDPGDLVIVREIVTPPPTPGTVDTAVFSGPRSNYTITIGPDKVVVNQTGPDVVGQRTSDGIDTLTNIEKLQFSDQAVNIGPVAVVAPLSRTFAPRQVNTTPSAPQTVNVSNTGNRPLHVSTVTLVGTNPGDFAISSNPCSGATVAVGASCTVGVTFTPTAAGSRSATLRFTDDSVTGPTQDATLSGTGTVGPPPNNLPTGRPSISDSTPQPFQLLTASTAGIADADGIGTPFTFQWQQTAQNGAGAFTNVPGATGATFRVPLLGSLGRRYQVVVRFTDGTAHQETVTSLPTSPVTIVGGGSVPTAAAVAAPVATQLGQALAPRSATTPRVLRAGGLTVSAPAAAPLTVAATVPAGATAVRIAVFRLTGPSTRNSASHKAGGRRHIATVFRTAPKAQRYVFRLTEKPLRHLKPGRYAVEVRVGASRKALGAPSVRTITVRKGRVSNGNGNGNGA